MNNSSVKNMKSTEEIADEIFECITNSGPAWTDEHSKQEIYNALQAERDRAERLVKALEAHHLSWSPDGTVCLSECRSLCLALSEYKGEEDDR